MFDKFNRGRNQGNDDDADDYYAEVVFDNRDIPEKESGERKGRYPKNSTGDVVGKEAEIVHMGNAGDERSESADYRDESGDDDGFRSMSFIEIIGATQIILIKK